MAPPAATVKVILVDGALLRARRLHLSVVQQALEMEYVKDSRVVGDVVL